MLPHYVEIASEGKGIPYRVAYEDLRLLPHSKITKQLMKASVDTILNGEGESTSASVGMFMQGTDDHFTYALQAVIFASESRPVAVAMMGGSPVDATEDTQKAMGDYVQSTGEIVGN